MIFLNSKPKAFTHLSTVELCFICICLFVVGVFVWELRGILEGSSAFWSIRRGTSACHRGSSGEKEKATCRYTNTSQIKWDKSVMVINIEEDGPIFSLWNQSHVLLSNTVVNLLVFLFIWDYETILTPCLQFKAAELKHQCHILLAEFDILTFLWKNVCSFFNLLDLS